MTHTDPRDGSDAPIPPNVRMYDVAGASHSLNTVATHPNCKLPLARINEAFDLMHAGVDGNGNPACRATKGDAVHLDMQLGNVRAGVDRHGEVRELRVGTLIGASGGDDPRRDRAV